MSLLIKGWRAIHKAVNRHERILRNVQIQRTGTTDTVSATKDSLTINLQRFPKAGEAGVSINPFPLEPIKIGSDKVKFRYGTCHGLPVKIGAVAITGEFSDAGNPELTITETGKIYIGVDLAADTYEAQNPVIAAGATVPADVDQSKAYHELCPVTLTAGVISLGQPVHNGSLDVASCGGVVNYWDLG